MANYSDIRSRRRRRLSTDSGSSSSTSPDRGRIDDDAESFVLNDADSISSLAPTLPDEHISHSRAREIEEQNRVSPISRLPAEIMIAVFARLSSSADLRACMLVSREWAKNSVQLLWHRPTTAHWWALHSVVQSIRNANTYFDYYNLVKRLNLSSMGQQVSDGTLIPFAACKRIERLTLTNCPKLTDLSVARMIQGNRSLLALDVTGLDGITDVTMNVVADNCMRLQGLNVTNCRKITDDSLEHVAHSCRYIKRLKLNGCQQLTDRSIIAFAQNCRSILEIDLADCKLLEDDAVSALITEGQQLRELRLAHCSRITDNAFLSLPQDMTFESLRILDLTDCGELQDAGVQKIVQAAPRLRNLVLAKCRQITDRAVVSITRLGKNLHYIHLGHCQRITDVGVQQLVKLCNRIRYIDLACCTNLTDNSVQQLATLPKLKRIGLVKCGNITDSSIYALAKPKAPFQGGLPTPSSLERVHLSYCTLLSLSGIHALLNNCPRLTHLSLTGVQAFLREDLLVHCREAPPEFNDHQRDVFCVFSGQGVNKLREQLNADVAHQQLEGETNMFDDAAYEPMYDGNGFPLNMANNSQVGSGAQSWPGATIQIPTPQQNHTQAGPPPPPPVHLQINTNIQQQQQQQLDGDEPPSPLSGEPDILTFESAEPPRPLDVALPMFPAEAHDSLVTFSDQVVHAHDAVQRQFQQMQRDAASARTREEVDEMEIDQLQVEMDRMEAGPSQPRPGSA